jgi:hypothetical protein
MSENKDFVKCQNNGEASPKWLCLPMVINLGNLGNLGNRIISATGFHPEISLKGIPLALS